MANCINCSAPLPPDSTVCGYCKTRNDVDLKGLTRHRVEEPQSERTCPRCQKALQTIDLKLEGKFLIERCTDCMGLFFDPGELEAMLDKSVSNVFHIDRGQLENLNKVHRHDEYPVGYIKCPVCQKMMNRINFGSRSGVIVDTCKDHGLWLDGGELRQLMEWTKAGGQMLHQQKQAEMEKMEQQAKQRRAKDKVSGAGGMPMTMDPADGGGFTSLGRGAFAGGGMVDAVDLLGVVTNVVARFFR